MIASVSRSPIGTDGGDLVVVQVSALTTVYHVVTRPQTAAQIKTDVACIERGLSSWLNGVAHYFNFRIDPSGTIEDTNGNPVSGATVTLLHADSAAGPFTAPASGSPIMVPSTNPETTGTDGIFHWDVFAGYYEVTASKPGCTDPNDASKTTVYTAPLPVPPPQVGLVLTLSCPNEPPPPLPVVTGLSPDTGPGSGGTPVDISGSGFTNNAAVSFGGKPATGITVVSPTDILATAPPGMGTVDVQVTTNGGTSAVATTDEFAYTFAIITTSLPDGVVFTKTNKAVYKATLFASPGNPPYKCTLLPGTTLPPGLRLNSKGVITGKAKSAGTYTFTVVVVDKKTRVSKTAPYTQNRATEVLTITISP